MKKVTERTIKGIETGDRGVITVKELMELLSTADPEAQVVLNLHDSMGYHEGLSLHTVDGIADLRTDVIAEQSMRFLVEGDFHDSEYDWMNLPKRIEFGATVVLNVVNQGTLK